MDLGEVLDELREIGWADEADALEAMASHLLRTVATWPVTTTSDGAATSASSSTGCATDPATPHGGRRAPSSAAAPR